MTSSGISASWWSRAACQLADPELFFPVSALEASTRSVARAKAICGRCGVRPECLAHAMESGPLQGIWGGTTEDDRRRLRTRATRAKRRLAVAAVAPGRTHLSGR